MWVRALLCCMLLSPLFFLAPTTAEPTKAEPTAPKARPTYKSPLGLVVDDKGEKAYVALNSAGAVAVVDLKAGKVLSEIPVGKQPTDAALLGKKLFVICPGDQTLVPVNLEQRKAEKPIPLGRTPQSIYVYEREGTLFLGLYHDPQSGVEHGLQYDPHTRKLTTDHASPSRPEYSLYREARNHLPTTQIAQGWVFLNGLSFNGFFGKPHTFFPLDELQRAYGDLGQMLDPSVSESDSFFIASAAADAVLVVDNKRFLKVAQARKPGYGVGSGSYGIGGGGFGLADSLNLTKPPTLYDDLTLTRRYVVARIPTQSNPRRLALSGDKKTLVVSNYRGDSLTVIDTKTLKVVRHIPLGGPEPDAVRRGEILFNSGKMTFHGQFTCASCHPNGGSDGLTWDLTRDGIGNFKKTKSLLGVKDTAPYGWEGSSPTLEDRIAGTLRTLHQHEPEGTEVEDIAAYLRSLPPPRPWPVEKEDQPAVARGEKLFKDKAQCAKCHQPPTFQDGKLHDIGTRGPTDTTARFDTPSLRGIERYPTLVPAYLHDGRAETLEEVFTKHNDAKKHGAADRLSKDELADLLKYLSSL